MVTIGAQSAPRLVVSRAVATVALHSGLQGSSAGRLSKVESADGASEKQSPAWPMPYDAGQPKLEVPTEASNIL